MTIPVARIGDTDTNHPPCGPGACATGSSNVFANMIPVHRVGDVNTPHGYILCIPHVTPLASGAATVMSNFQQVGRIGDPYSCGIAVASGSPNVFAGDVAIPPVAATMSNIGVAIEIGRGTSGMAKSLARNTQLFQEQQEQSVAELQALGIPGIFNKKDAEDYIDSPAHKVSRNCNPELYNKVNSGPGVAFKGLGGNSTDTTQLSSGEANMTFGGPEFKEEAIKRGIVKADGSIDAEAHGILKAQYMEISMGAMKIKTNPEFMFIRYSMGGGLALSAKGYKNPQFDPDTAITSTPKAVYGTTEPPVADKLWDFRNFFLSIQGTADPRNQIVVELVEEQTKVTTHVADHETLQKLFGKKKINPCEDQDLEEKTYSLSTKLFDAHTTPAEFQSIAESVGLNYLPGRFMSETSLDNNTTMSIKPYGKSQAQITVKSKVIDYKKYDLIRDINTREQLNNIINRYA